MIPFVDLKAQYHSIKAEVDEAVLRVLESSQFVLGKEVAAFEEDFAAYCGSKFALGVNSGTSALHLIVRGLGLGEGDEVITTPFSFIASANWCGVVRVTEIPFTVWMPPSTWPPTPASATMSSARDNQRSEPRNPPNRERWMFCIARTSCTEE